MRTTTTTETVQELRATQPVWTTAMQEACGTATTVRVTRARTFAGTFVVNVEPVA